jgi:hypothetical protein
MKWLCSNRKRRDGSALPVCSFRSYLQFHRRGCLLCGSTLVPDSAQVAGAVGLLTNRTGERDTPRPGGQDGRGIAPGSVLPVSSGSA